MSLADEDICVWCGEPAADDLCRKCKIWKADLRLIVTEEFRKAFG